MAPRYLRVLLVLVLVIGLVLGADNATDGNATTTTMAPTTAAPPSRGIIRDFLGIFSGIPLAMSVACKKSGDTLEDIFRKFW